MINPVVAVLAAKRLTQLVVDDEIVKPVRDRILDWADGHEEGSFPERVAYLVGCPACTSVWAGAFAVVAESSKLGRILNRVLAISGAVLMINRYEDYR